MMGVGRVMGVCVGWWEAGGTTTEEEGADLDRSTLPVVKKRREEDLQTTEEESHCLRERQVDYNTQQTETEDTDRGQIKGLIISREQKTMKNRQGENIRSPQLFVLDLTHLPLASTPSSKNGLYLARG